MASSPPPSETYEEENVHRIYQEIAQHFSSTRYKVRLCLPYKAIHT